MMDPIDVFKNKILKNSTFGVTLDDIENSMNDDALQQIQDNSEQYFEQLSQNITFVNDILSDIIKFTTKNLYLIGAYSGNGKSTLAANITLPLLQQGKKVLILTNEEQKEDVLSRLFALNRGLNWNMYKKNQYSPEITGSLTRPQEDEQYILENVRIVAAGEYDNLTTYLEGIQHIMDKAAEGNYACILIDYYQNIGKSKSDPSRSKFSILDDLKVYLQQFIGRHKIPVVLFAQLHSLQKRNGGPMDMRIKDCPTIYEAATACIELVPNFEDSTSSFLIHKDRFGYTGKKAVCRFDRGRFLGGTTAELNSWIQTRKIQAAQNAVAQIVSTHKDSD